MSDADREERAARARGASSEAAGEGGIVVIGAGPAGLNVAARLRERGLPCRVLERDREPGASWRRMPRDMRLNSPAGVSVLGDTRVGLLERNRIWTRARFHRHLLDFWRERELDVELGVHVKRIARDGNGGFRIETGDGPIDARVVVNATGYFGKPYVPRRPGDEDTALLRLTVPEYGSPEAVAERIGGRPGRILIVGARITAGQVGVELHDAGFAVTISHRQPIAFGFDPRVQRLGFALYYRYEAMRLSDPAFAKRDSGHPMQGGRARRLIESGAIATRPDVAGFGERTVRFTDGREEPFDVVLWATGYRPSLDHLQDLVELDPDSGLPELEAMESTRAPGLFFLGLDQQTDFTSRMLRGIRADAERLAERLARRSPATETER